MCDSGTVLQSYGRCVVVRFRHVLLLTVLDKSYTQLTLTIPGVQLSCTAHQIYLLFPLTSSHLCKTFSWFIMRKFLIQKHNIVKLSWIGNCLEYLLHVKKVMNHFKFHSSVIIDADLCACPLCCQILIWSEEQNNLEPDVKTADTDSSPRSVKIKNWYL